MTSPNLWNLDSFRPRAQATVAGDTIHALFWNGVAARGDSVLMRQKDFGIWRGWSWRECGAIVRELAMGLAALDVRPGDCVSVLSNTRVEWVWCDLAVLSTGGVSNGIYPTDAASQVHYLCEDSRTTILFVEDDEQLDKALEVRAQLPRLRKIVVFDMEGLSNLDEPDVISLDALRALGRDYLKAHPTELKSRSDACKPEDLAILVYTSGTTGKPKGAMHLHQGLVFKDFNLTFTLAEHLQVSEAKFENGLLHIDLTRNEPEQIAPQRIAISERPALNS